MAPKLFSKTVSNEVLAEMLASAEQKYCFDDPLIAALRELQQLRAENAWVKSNETLLKAGDHYVPSSPKEQK